MKIKKKVEIPKLAGIAIVYRPDTIAALSLAKALSAWLRQRGHKVFTAPEQKLIAGTSLMRKKSDFSKIGLVVVLGGDGTYLRAVRLLDGLSSPILGVNLGSLGFLTTTRADELFTAVEQALNGKMDLCPRAMLDVQLLHRGKEKARLLALNDVVVERGSLSQLINISIHESKYLVSELKADGIIIASPTGSTAYNVSAGGPILHPDVQAIVVAPISPHSLSSRPLIFPDNKELSFRLVSKLHPKQKTAHFVVDGVKVADLTGEDEIIIKRSSKDHYMLKDPRLNYFHVLREKLKFGDRP